MTDQRPCFEIHNTLRLPCEKIECKNHLSSLPEDELNCVILAARSGERTLSEVGDLLGVTRMRICQIQGEIMTRIRDQLDVADPVAARDPETGCRLHYGHVVVGSSSGRRTH